MWDSSASQETSRCTDKRWRGQIREKEERGIATRPPFLAMGLTGHLTARRNPNEASAGSYAKCLDQPRDLVDFALRGSYRSTELTARLESVLY